MHISPTYLSCISDANARNYRSRVVDKIRLNKLRWAGHLIRKGEKAEKLSRDNIYGRKWRRGRPYFKWEALRKDIELMDLGDRTVDDDDK